MEKNTSLNNLFVSIEEMRAVIALSPQERYNYTLKRIADTEIMWTIGTTDNFIITQVCENQKLFSVWSAKEYAQKFCETSFLEYECIAITLEYFESEIIDMICCKDIKMNVFPKSVDSVGLIVDINTFADDLGKILEDYD